MKYLITQKYYLQELRQGSALYPVSFLLRYEFVDVSEQGQPLAESQSACDRVFKSAQTYSGRFQAPRAIFYYGRGGSQNLTCILRYVSIYEVCFNLIIVIDELNSILYLQI